jgi:hypothetical protein
VRNLRDRRTIAAEFCGLFVYPPERRLTLEAKKKQEKKSSGISNADFIRLR